MTLLELFQLLKKHLKLVITLPVVCAIAMGILYRDDEHVHSRQDRR